MKKTLFIIFSLLKLTVYSQPHPVTTRNLGRSNCEEWVMVKDAKTNCSDACQSYMFPVINEEFDYNYDLPNKWHFKYSYTDDDNGGGTSWVRDGYFNGLGEGYTDVTNHNVKPVNGVLKIISKRESTPVHGYNFTAGMIESLNRFQYGVFEAKIRIPNCEKMFPAFWLLHKLGNYSEIDIFEYQDGNLTGPFASCDSYSDHQITIHEGFGNSKSCLRGDKYPIQDVSSQGISVPHVYRLEWNEQEVLIYVDGIPKGRATKYYHFAYMDFVPCHYSTANSIDPRVPYSCSDVNGLEDNIYQYLIPPKPDWVPDWAWPNIPTWLYFPNKVIKDYLFPSKDRPMSVILNNNINGKYKNESFSEYTEDQQTMLVEWVRIYQPFCCGIDKTIYTNADFAIASSYTGILTGRKLKFGTVNTCDFSQNHPNSSNYEDLPVFLLATDEIEINGDATFPGDTYAEMRIVSSCSGLDRMMNDKNNEGTGSDTENQSQNIQEQSVFAKEESTSTIDLYPIPTNDQVILKCDEVTFEEISSLAIIDINGSKFDLQKSKTINLESFNAGYYQLMIIFNNKPSIYKKIIKL